MNNCFIKLCFFILILSSCTKGNLTNENVPNFELEEPEAIIINQPAVNSDRLAVLNPPSVDLYCFHTPAVIVPQVEVNESINLIFARAHQYNGEPIKPKAIKWQVNGEPILQLTSQLKLPYEIGDYHVNTMVTLLNGDQLIYEFTLDVKENMVLTNDGYIDYFGCRRCLTLIPIEPCCSHQHWGAFVCPII